MSNRRGTQLFNSGFNGSSAGNAVLFDGGRGAIVITADQYGGGVFLQLQNGPGKWIAINGTTYSADQVTAYDLPKGQYRLISNQGSSLAVTASLVPISYGG